MMTLRCAFVEGSDRHDQTVIRVLSPFRNCGLDLAALTRWRLHNVDREARGGAHEQRENALMCSAIRVHQDADPADRRSDLLEHAEQFRSQLHDRKAGQVAAWMSE